MKTHFHPPPAAINSSLKVKKNLLAGADDFGPPNIGNMNDGAIDGLGRGGTTV